MFKITEGKGFHIQFENGWVVSVQWGAGNYGQNYSRSCPNPPESRETLNRILGAKGAAEAEVAIWNKTMDNEMQVWDYPMTPEELVQLLLEVATRDS
jgi:hypothetical protein